jgi:hypothetical protein
MLKRFVAIGVPNGKKATNTGLEQTAALGRHHTGPGAWRRLSYCDS